MKTKNSPLILTLLLALLAFSAAHAQSDGNKQWGTHVLRVHIQPGKRPTIADFARAFTKQYPTPLNTAVLAKLDGKAPQPKSCALEYLLDAPSGYLKYSFHENTCNRTDYPTMEMCYWRTEAGHCLVAVNGNTYMGNLLLVFYDYDPATGLMTPRSALPFKDFYDDVREFIVQLPRKGKDIHLEGWSDRSAPAPSPSAGTDWADSPWSAPPSATDSPRPAFGETANSRPHSRLASETPTNTRPLSMCTSGKPTKPFRSITGPAAPPPIPSHPATSVTTSPWKRCRRAGRTSITLKCPRIPLSNHHTITPG